MRGTQLNLVLLCAIFAFGFALPFISARDDHRTAPFHPTRPLAVRTDERQPRLELLLEKNETYGFHVRQLVSDPTSPEVAEPKARTWNYRFKVDRVAHGTTALSITVATPDTGPNDDPVSFTCTVLVDGSLRDLPKHIDRSGVIATHLELFLGSGLHTRPLSAKLPLAVGVRGPRAASLPSNLWFNWSEGQNPKRVEFAVVSEKANAPTRAARAEGLQRVRQRDDSNRRIGVAEYDAQRGLLERATLRYVGENLAETTLAIRRVSIDNPARGARSQ